MNILDSESSKKENVDTRNNWVTFMFKTKCAYQCFRKQSHIDTCTATFREFEAHGFVFGEFGFGGNHVHFDVNVPKKYSVMVAEIMLKSRSAMRMFENHPGVQEKIPARQFLVWIRASSVNRFAKSGAIA